MNARSGKGMHMDDYGTTPEPRAIRFERLLPGPVELVWEYLTDPDKRGTWLAKGPMELAVGGAVELRFHHADLSAEATPERMRGEDHVNRGQITRCEPPFLLAFTWNDATGDSEVEFELRPRGDDVLLVLTHRRLAEAELQEVAAGWHAHLGILGARIGGDEPWPFWTTWTRLHRAYGERLGSKPDASGEQP